MTIRYLGQSGYLLKAGFTEILIDPYLSDSVNRIAGRPRQLPIPIRPAEIHCDAVICTHSHADHLDPDTVSEIKEPMRYLTTHEGKRILSDMGTKTVRAFATGDSVTVGNFEITAVFAAHTVEAFGLIVSAEKITLYFSGDTLFHEKLFEIARFHPDVAFYCINGRLGNMNVREALTVAERIDAAIQIPNHYDMFASNAADPLLFSERIKGGRVLSFDKTYSLTKQNDEPVMKEIPFHTNAPSGL